MNKTKITFDGNLAKVVGDCPLPSCKWTFPHHHAKEYLHDYAKERAQSNKPTLPALGPAPVTNPTTPAQRIAARHTETSTPKQSTQKTFQPPAAKPPEKKKTINVYRIRTVSEQLSVDKTVAADRRKEAVVAARKSHSMMLSIPLDQVSLSFARFIGKYEVKPVYHYHGQGMHSFPGWDDDYGYGYL